MKYFLSFFSLLLACVAFQPAQNDGVRFYVGTGAKGPESSISLCELNTKDGTISRIDTFNSSSGPGYLSLSPNKKQLYSVNQDHSLAAYEVGAGGTLTYLNKQSSEGLNPCHVSVHPSGKMAFLANYTGGSWTAYPLASNGKAGTPAAKFQLTGSGPNTARQEKAHAHCVLSSPDGKYIYVSDLGSDKLMNYSVDAATGSVKPNPAQAFFATSPGAGPRHFVIHPSGKFLYLLNELKGTLTTCSIDNKGVVTELETVPTLPADFSDANKSAAIRLHPNQKFVYVSNRGYNAVTGYEIQKNGTLKKITEARQAIDTPRDFNFDPSGRWMVVGNQGTNDLSVYRVNPKTGALTFSSQSISIKDPICFVFL
ncbi:lactonase family protein [Arundinibacter roseus]|uniref:Lactonase family protein n=1 Tax=Arundinibacter roseus TaxID=2070510 RepID=A0A4R4K6W0_9BACT|nr:lactonase family protein [Arundinibacter roseus]TDB62306.1 lactonase family protein [Arundinibacter roseus]